MDDVLSSFSSFSMESETKREICSGCSRPSNVCWCPFLPREPIQVTTRVIILQHKYEEKRRLKTAPMLQKSLASDKCYILQGSRFPLSKNKLLSDVVRAENTFLLYPSPDAVDIDELNPVPDKPKTLILLDGTWSQAKGIYMKNHWLHDLKQVKLSEGDRSEYVIRTQPTEASLSTLESAAMALAQLENRPDIVETLVRPLRGMCDFQLQHGAVKHHSKEFLLSHGLYKKQALKPWDKVGRSRPRHRPKKHATTGGDGDEEDNTKNKTPNHTEVHVIPETETSSGIRSKHVDKSVLEVTLLNSDSIDKNADDAV